MEKDRQIGVLGPLLLNADGSFQLSYGRKISLCAEFYQKTLAPLVEKWRYARRRGRSIVRETAWVSGACLLTRRELFAGQQPFDENMFLYFEDHDLCLRVRAMGKKVVYYGGARVRHHGGRSVRRAARHHARVPQKPAVSLPKVPFTLANVFAAPLPFLQVQPLAASCGQRKREAGGSRHPGTTEEE